MADNVTVDNGSLTDYAVSADEGAGGALSGHLFGLAIYDYKLTSTQISTHYASTGLERYPYVGGGYIPS